MHNKLYNKWTIKHTTWDCCLIRIFNSFIKIHYHYGPNEWYKKPKFRLRRVSIGKWKLPLKYYEI